MAPGSVSVKARDSKVQAGRFELELLAIRTLCAGKEAGIALLNNLNTEYFHYPTTKLMYRRVMARLKGEGAVPAWNDLLNDPTVPEEKRVQSQRLVRIKKIKPLITSRQGDALFNSLDRYRKLRALFELVSKAGNSLQQPTADIDEIIDQVKRGAIAIDVNQKGAPITVDGVTGTHVVEAFTNADALIKTGFKAYDDISGGIPEGAVFLMGADTGGYKSVAAMQVGMNMAKNKRRVGFYSLEMTQPEVVRRQTANIVEVNATEEMIKYIHALDKAATPDQVAKVRSDMQAKAVEISNGFVERTKDWTQFFHITCPSDEVDINWVLQQAEMSDREVIILDYVGLLAGLSGDDQWRAMSNVVRQAKIWTNRTFKTIIILAQMRFDDGKPELKYSKAVLDHCNNAFGWTTLYVNGRTYLCVHQMKARGYAKFPFVLRVYPEFSKIADLVDAADDEVARLAVEDMKAGKDPAARYKKEVNGNEEKGRRVINVEGDDEPLLVNGGFSGAKSYDVSGDPPWETDSPRKQIKAVGDRITAAKIVERANLQTRAIALSKLSREYGSLTVEEAGIQAEEVVKRWEEASAGHRIGVDQIAKELLGLTATREMLTQIRRLQGDAAARKRLSKTELEIHKAQVETVKIAMRTIKTKGSEFVSEDDFYAKDDLTLSVARGEEPIADPKSLDAPWQNNAVAWADQPAITLPNSAKPKEKRWGNTEQESVAKLKRTLKAVENSRAIVKTRVVLWPPKKGSLDDYHYLDDIQLDTAVGIAEKLAVCDLNTVPTDMLVRQVSKYIELIGPGVSRVHNRKHRRVVFNKDSYEAARKKLGLSNAA